MTALPHSLERTVVIQAPRDTVFQFLTRTALWANWWGAGSSIDATPGGTMRICYPGGILASGHVVEVSAPERIVFTYGFDSGTPIPSGSSRVTITLAQEPGGTRLTLTHDFDAVEVRDEHVQGWRYQLALFSNLVADLVNANATGVVDAWFDLWANPNADARASALREIASPDLRFRDRYGHTNDLNDLLPHIEAAQRFMPGIRLRRSGTVRHCQGTVLVDWSASTADGQARGSGTNVFVLDANAKIVSVTGFIT